MFKGRWRTGQARLEYLIVCVALVLPIAGTRCRAADSSLDKTAWGKPVDGLRLGVEWNESLKDNPLLVFLENVGTRPKDVFFLTDYTATFEFSATALDGTLYHVVDRLLYFPDGGLGPFPTVEHLLPSTIRRFPFTAERFFYVPDAKSKGETLKTLGTLLKDGSKAHASLKLDEQDWKNWKLSPENAWMGELTSGDVRERFHPSPETVHPL